MRYADFHPQYSDLAGYFANVEESFGLGEIPHFSPHPEKAAGQGSLPERRNSLWNKAEGEGFEPSSP
jgi:hypothetical protein